jgi:hypothetical protein
MKDLLFALLFLGFILSLIGIVCEHKATPRWLSVTILSAAMCGILMTAGCAIARFL